MRFLKRNRATARNPKSACAPARKVNYSLRFSRRPVVYAHGHGAVFLLVHHAHPQRLFLYVHGHRAIILLVDHAHPRSGWQGFVRRTVQVTVGDQAGYRQPPCDRRLVWGFLRRFLAWLRLLRHVARRRRKRALGLGWRDDQLLKGTRKALHHLGACERRRNPAWLTPCF